MRAALVHDWLTGMRGGEKVLEELVLMFPDAEIHALLHVPGSVSQVIESRPIHTSFIQRLPAHSAYRWYLPLFPAAIRTLDPGPVDLVVSSSHCAAKAVLAPRGAVHVCYCHTPMRYAWDQFPMYFSAARNGRLRFQLIRAIMAWLRRWDRVTASRVDAFAANSRYVANRIRQYYDRAAEIIPPPVDTDRFTPGSGRHDSYWLMVSALSPYKRIEIAIEAFNRSGRQLVIAGWGPERERLQSLAGPSVEFAGKVSDQALLQLYRGCHGFLLPGIEDAGIAPLEAMACGRPAVVLDAGGAREAVIPGETGLLIEAPSAAAINSAVDSAEHLSFNTDKIRAHAEHYSRAAFRRRMRRFIERTLSGSGGSGPRETPPVTEGAT